MHSSLHRTALILAASISTALAEAPTPPPAVDLKPTPAQIDLKDGDTWVFLGDSITHQCLYTQYVEDFVYTRMPKARIHFHNAGVSGDRAQDALVRFEDDIASFKPKYVTMLLGMNDGGYKAYDQPTFDTYQQGMTLLLDKLAAIGATAVPMTPTMFDSRVNKLNPAKANETKELYYNGVLSLYGSWLREQAYSRGLGFVDMWSPLNDYTLVARKKDPKFTMIPDAVHPAPTGQVVMAVAIVENLLPRNVISSVVTATEKGKYVIHPARSKATNLQKTDTGVSFDLEADSLPWVLPPDAVEGLTMTHAGHHFGNEKITIRDLTPGMYEVKIDGTPVAKLGAGQLAFGLELEGNDKTPEYQQALKVALLNKQRNDEAMHPLRDQWSQMKRQHRDLAQATANKDPKLDEKQKAFDAWQAGFKKTVTELLAKARSFEDQIYQANQPVPHHYEITAVK